MARRLFDTGEAETSRVEAFSDGVLAIVITLLVLEIKPPAQHLATDAELWRALLERLPAIGAWAVSFAFVLVFWVAHHYLFAQLAKVNRGLLWLNGLFLLAISFTPFPTALVGEYPASKPAVFLLSLAMFLTAASFTVLRWYASFGAGLTRPDISRTRLKRAMRKSLLAPVLYGIATASALVWTPPAILIQILVPIIFFIPARE